MKRILALAGLFILYASIVFGANCGTGTCYVNPDCVSTCNGTTMDNGYTTIQEALDANTTANTLFILSGGAGGRTYSPAATVTSKANCTIKGSTAATHNGWVTISGSGHSSHVLRTDHNVTLQNLELTAASGTNYLVAMLTDGKTSSISNCTLSGAGAGRGVYHQGTLTITNSIFSAIPYIPINTQQTTAVANIYYNKFLGGVGTSYGAYKGTHNVYNNIFVGGTSGTLEIATNTSQVVNVKNNIFVGNSTLNNNKHTITDSTSGGAKAVVTASNNVILANPFNPITYNVNNFTDAAAIYKYPKFVSDRRPKYMLHWIDGYSNYGMFKDVADYANARGHKVSYCIGDAASVSGTDWTTLNAYVTAGNSVAGYARNVVNLTNLNAITIVGPASSTVSIAVTTTNASSANWTGTLTCKVSGATVGTPLSLTGTTTLANVKTYIDALGGGWGATVHASTATTCLAVGLAAVTDQVCTGAGYLALYNQNQFLFIEVAEPKKIIETNITGYTVKGHVAPGGTSSTSLMTWLSSDSHGMFTKAGTTPFLASFKADGSYTLGGDYSSGTTPAAGLQVFDMYKQNLETVIGSTNIERNVHSIIAMLGYIGGVYSLTGHDEATYSLANNKLVIDAYGTAGITIPNADTVIDYIRAGTDADATGLRWTRTYTDSSDYRLAANSPALTAGTDLCSSMPGATDYSGRVVCVGTAMTPTGAKPSIGAYQYPYARSLGGGYLGQ